MSRPLRYLEFDGFISANTIFTGSLLASYHSPAAKHDTNISSLFTHRAINRASLNHVHAIDCHRTFSKTTIISGTFLTHRIQGQSLAFLSLQTIVFLPETNADQSFKRAQKIESRRWFLSKWSLCLIMWHAPRINLEWTRGHKLPGSVQWWTVFKHEREG